jgi:CBS domain-containing protein
MEVLRLLMAEGAAHLVFVTSADGRLEGVVTKSDVLRALSSRNGSYEGTGDGHL